ncbi:cyclin-dependent kinase G-2 [Tripterygium wilfordii]|uniref:cyclin-dependent kinase n=1 Tax=Tripterygium wilfordii TaxID=458696 RepID=A0A7J7BXV0_TRIWF|nr:cyclin-dependent kinase G-2-like [Tripterygium wilfordii]KAF5726684.1 cyclin-dependent kinase G-2 [Tripterygium wilfordii]
MAAERHRSFRDSEFRGRESGIEVSRRNFAHPKEEYDRSRNGGNSNNDGRAQARGIRDKGRLRQKDIKERDVINGGYRSSSSRSDSGSGGGGHWPQGSGFSVRAVDREPGELSSESGSEDAIESESQIKDSEASETVENGIRASPLVKKRKFSPIVWDRDDREVSNSSRSRISTTVAALPPSSPLPKVYLQSPDVVPGGGIQISPIEDSKTNDLQLSSPVEPSVAALPPLPPLPKLYLQSPNVVPGGGIQISPIEDGKTNGLQLSSPVEPSVASKGARDSPFESPLGLSSSTVKELQWGIYQEAEQLDDDYVPTWNISSSRWAAGNNSPVDEGEIVEEEMPRRKKKMMHIESLDAEVRNKSKTPEAGEPQREGSEGARARSSESDERGVRTRSFSGDDYTGTDSEKDYMDIDEERNNNNNSLSRSDTDTEEEDDSHATPEPLAPPQRSINMLQGCRSVDEFERLNKIDEGTYGVVYRARDKKTGEIVALKKVKMEKEREGFPLTSLREINILLSFHHPSIVDVKEVVVGSSLDSIFMVMEYMEHDLKGLMESMKQPFSQSEVKCLMLQLLEGVKYLHDNWVLHRDMKTSNLLLNNRGELKICDFGLARQYGSPLKPYTHLVVTLWYRAPELLLGAKQYSTAIDMWSLGCIMAELLAKEPLFNGKTEFDQLDKIFRTLGTPNETIWPGFSRLPGVKVNFVKQQYNMLRKKFPATSFTGSPVLSDAGFDLLNKLLTYDPEKRITAKAALDHEWFKEVPLPKSKDFMPTFPAQHAQDRRLRRIMKSPDPLEEQRKRELQQGDLGASGLFG